MSSKNMLLLLARRYRMIILVGRCRIIMTSPAPAPRGASSPLCLALALNISMVDDDLWRPGLKSGVKRTGRECRLEGHRRRRAPSNGIIIIPAIVLVLNGELRKSTCRRHRQKLSSRSGCQALVASVSAWLSVPTGGKRKTSPENMMSLRNKRLRHLQCLISEPALRESRLLR